MKIKAEKKVLLDAVLPTLCALSSKALIPSLECSYLSAKDGILTVTGYDLAKGVKSETSVIVEEEGEVLLNAQKFIRGYKDEDGISEQDAIESLGSIDEIVKSILSDIPIKKLVKEKFGLKRKLKTWEIVLLSLTSIIWIPLLIVFMAIILTLYICLWSGVMCVGAISIGALAESLICALGVIDVVSGNFGSGIVLIGFSMFFAGVAILTAIATFKFGKLMVIVCKKIILWIKSLFIKRGENYEV